MNSHATFCRRGSEPAGVRHDAGGPNTPGADPLAVAVSFSVGRQWFDRGPAAHPARQQPGGTTILIDAGSEGSPRQGRDPLLLLPGTCCDHRVFAPAIAGLDEYEVVHGRLGSVSSSAAQAALILRDAPRRFALLGFSLGGIVALDIMRQAPERVSRLALIGSVSSPSHPDDARYWAQALARATSDGLATFILDSWPAQVAAANAEREALRELLVDMAVETGLERLAAQAAMAATRTDSQACLSGIDCETLVIAGTEDVVCPWGGQVHMASSIKNARLLAIPDAGHFALLEQPATVAREIRVWLGLGGAATNAETKPRPTASPTSEDPAC